MKEVERVRNGKVVKARFKTYNRVCEGCSTEFETMWVRSRYCSKPCYMSKLHERTKAWRKTEKGSIWYKQYSIDRFRLVRINALVKLGGCCKSCGYSDIRALHIDHVDGDGKSERGIRKTIYRKIVGGEVDLARYQLLCANCNWIKRLENNEGSNLKDFNGFMLQEMEKLNSANPKKVIPLFHQEKSLA